MTPATEGMLAAKQDERNRLRLEMAQADLEATRKQMRAALEGTVRDLQREIRRLDEDGLVEYYLPTNVNGNLAQAHQRLLEAGAFADAMRKILED